MPAAETAALDKWGWCGACQSMYSASARENPWSCPSGGRHNRNVLAPDLEQRSGRYEFTARRGDRLIDESVAAVSSSIPDPVAEWPFADHLDDVVSTVRRSTVVGVPPTLVDGSAARFVGGGIEAVDPQLGLGGGEVTLSWWMRPEPEQTQNAVIIDQRSGIESASARERATHGFAVSLNSGRVSVQLADGLTSQNYVSDMADVLPNPPRWTMVSVAVGESLRVFVDGTLVDAYDSAALGSRSGASRDANGRSLFIGRHRVEGGPAFHGDLADLKVFDAELSPTQVSDLYEMEASARQPLPAQNGWLGCVACGCLVFRGEGDPTPSGCQALGAGPHAVDATAAYDVIADDSSGHDSSCHDGWARCGKCAVAFFAPFATVSACGAGGEHEAAERLGPIRMIVAPDLTAAEPKRAGPRVLFLGANKRGHTVLELQTEKRYLEEVTEDSSLDVRGLLNASASTILGELHDNGPSIVQFSAHGSDSDDGAGLWLEDSEEPTTGAELAAMFATANKERTDGGVQVVLLNACQSVETGRAIAEHVPFVVAVEDDIPDEAAVFFTPLLYEQLAKGRDIVSAVAHARRQLVDAAHFDADQIPDFVHALPEGTQT